MVKCRKVALSISIKASSSTARQLNHEIHPNNDGNHIIGIEQTRGSKHVRAIVVSTCAAMLALGEKLPSAPTARLSLLLGW